MKMPILIVNDDEVKKNLSYYLSKDPIKKGRSKHLYLYKDNLCLVKLIPDLRSYTFDREESIEGTDVLRLDFFNLVVDILSVRLK